MTVRKILNRAFEGLSAYRATFADLAAPAGIAVRIAGATGMVIRIKTVHMSVPSNQTQSPLIIAKYSTAPTDGTATNPQSVPLDSNSKGARAAVNLYTVAPTAGTLIGEVFEDDISSFDSDAFRGDRVHEEFGRGDGSQSLILRSAAENVGIVLSDADTPINGYIEWTEEAGIATPTPGV